MQKTSISLFSASINFGLEKGYTKEKIDKEAVIRYLQQCQDELITTDNVYLSCAISDTEIVLSGQREAHLKLQFINYPRFPLPEKELKKHIENLMLKMMPKFEQNRIVIEYLDETVMLEQSREVDKRIIQNQE